MGQSVAKWLVLRSSSSYEISLWAVQMAVLWLSVIIVSCSRLWLCGLITFAVASLWRVVARSGWCGVPLSAFVRIVLGVFVAVDTYLPHFWAKLMFFAAKASLVTV